MISLTSIIFVYYIRVHAISSHVLFDIRTCDGGCRKNQDCATVIKNSICVPVINQKCGLCLCAVGFKKRRDQECVAIPEAENDVELVSAMSTDFTSVNSYTKGCGKDCADIKSNGGMSSMEHIESSTTRMVTKMEGNDIKMTKIDTFNVRSMIIPSITTHSRSKCPDIQSREIPCPGIETCYSGYCFRINEKKSFCVCTHGRIGKLCQMKKIAARNLDVAEIHDNSRFRHNKDPDHGSILGRHFAKSLNDCMKLCLWATSKQCRSINYGPVNSKMICELITISATRDDNSWKNKWIVDDQGWKYVTDFV